MNHLTQPSEARGSQAAEGSPPSGRSARILWAQLLARIYDVLPLLCPTAGGQMRTLAFLTDPPVVRSILIHVICPGLPPRDLPMLSAGHCSHRPSEHVLITIDPASPFPTPSLSAREPRPTFAFGP